MIWDCSRNGKIDLLPFPLFSRRPQTNTLMVFIFWYGTEEFKKYLRFTCYHQKTCLNFVCPLQPKCIYMTCENYWNDTNWIFDLQHIWSPKEKEYFPRMTIAGKETGQHDIRIFTLSCLGCVAISKPLRVVSHQQAGYPLERRQMWYLSLASVAALV